MADTTTSMHFAPLNDSNYTEWSVRMKAHLIQRKLWKVVDISEEGKTAKAFEDELEARNKDVMDEACAEMMLLVEGGQLSHAVPRPQRNLADTSTCSLCCWFCNYSGLATTFPDDEERR